MNGPSDALIELENLSGLAHHHHQLCDEPDCNTSLGLARKTAERLATQVDLRERQQAREILKRWPL